MAKDRDSDLDFPMEKVNSTEMQFTSEDEEEEQVKPSEAAENVIKDDSLPPSTVKLSWIAEEEDLPHSTRPSEESQQTDDPTHGDDDDHQEVPPPHGTRSRAQSSTRSTRPPAIKVPRDQRRGLLARLCFVDEITNAWDYSNSMKWTITAIVAIAGAAAPMGSAIVLPALVEITKDFHSTATVVNLSVAMYMLSMSIFPLWWSSFSETLGRRTIYVVSFFLFLIFNILSAVSVNIGMFIVMRV